LDDDRIGSPYSRHLFKISAIRGAAKLNEALKPQEAEALLQVPPEL